MSREGKKMSKEGKKMSKEGKRIGDVRWGEKWKKRIEIGNKWNKRRKKEIVILEEERGRKRKKGEKNIEYEIRNF